MGRIAPEVTNPVFKTVKSWTGDEPLACPWHAFRDPFVSRVLTAYPFYDKGQLLAVEPEPSHRLMMGVAHYAYVSSRVTTMQIEADRKERERSAEAARLRARHG